MFLLLLACTAGTEHDHSDHTTDDTGTEDTQLPEAWVEHYSATALLDVSGYEFEDDYLVRRFVDPEAGTISFEYVATADGTTTEIWWDVSDVDAAFDFSTSLDDYAGSGTLTGEPWAWSSWEYQGDTTSDDGTYVVGEGEFQGDTLHLEMFGYSAGDVQEWSLIEDLLPMSEADWQTAYDAL